ncbi:MAG: CBS domain-containing protein [Alphaproteobacteria bacterium]|nr:CBS domain-containing protein [Alphaproteobacteria bacterium]
MQAKDVMTTAVISVSPDTPVRDIAGILLTHRISAVPVVDGENRPVGIVSEGDLMRRGEIETENRRSWWLEALHSAEDKAAEYVKSHGMIAGDVMIRDVVTVAEDTPVDEIAALLEKRHVKRVPVLRDGKLVGIVSRANLLQGLARKGPAERAPVSVDDRTIRESLMRTLSTEAGLRAGRINVLVEDGAVQLWGLVESRIQKKAAQLAAENTPGVKSVENNLGQVPAWVSAN